MKTRLRFGRLSGGLLATAGMAFAGAFPAFAQQEIAASPASGARPPVDEPRKLYGARTTDSLQDVTSSVGIVSGGDIEERELRTLNDSFRLLGNVRQSENPGFVIRGMGSLGVQPVFSEPAATVFIDGVRQASPVPDFTNVFSRQPLGARGLWDVEQVEVYRGPQSTLVGRGALAGAIYLRTRDPVHGFETTGEGTVGTDEQRAWAAMVNLPVVQDQLAARFSAEYQRSETDINYPTLEQFRRLDEYAEDEYLNVRGKLLAEPKALSDTRALLSYSYAEDSPDVGRIFGPGRGLDFDDERGDPSNVFPLYEVRRARVHNTALEVTHGLTDRVTLTSHTGYSRSHTRRPSVNRGAPGEFETRKGFSARDLATQEFRLNYSGELLDATLGVYGSYEDAYDSNRNRILAAFGTRVFITEFSRETWNVAGFGEATYEFLPGWKALVGGRVDHTEKDISDFQWRLSTYEPPSPARDLSISPSDTVLLPKAGLIREFGPNHTVGFVVQRGFTEGGGSRVLSAPPYRAVDYGPEYAWNYELSYKGRLFGGRLDIAANAFYLDLQDQQVIVRSDPLDPTSARFMDNDGEAQTYGFEVEARAAVMDGLSALLSVGFVDAEFDDFDSAQVGDLSGNPLPEAPQWNVAAGAFYRHWSGFFVGADAEYTDQFRALARLASTPPNRIDGFVIANAQFGFQYHQLTATVFAENIFDEEYLLYRDRDDVETPGAGRLIGVSLDVKF